MNKEKIAELLKSDPNIDASTVQIDEHQVIFYTKGDPDEDSDQQPLFSTQELIKLEGGFVHMNDCEGCYNEGVVWEKEVQPTLREYYRPTFGTKTFDLASGGLLLSYDELMNIVPDSERTMDAELLEDVQHMTDWLNDLVSSVSKECEKCGCTLINSVCPNDI